MIAESVAFEKIVDADDKLAEAVATIKMQISQIAALKSQLEGANNKANELIGMVKSLKRQVAALEKENQQLRISALPV
jgi:phage shock protein A